ncbi:MAG TPA: hypothetical protein VMI94_25945 [Bryobacteraceae bacterium]|nr:hypothetical protein [Bryobacteraceae bacterium]
MAYRYPGSLCRYNFCTDIDSGTLCRQGSPMPGPVGAPWQFEELCEPGFILAAGAPEAITDDDKSEFKVIQEMPVYDRHHQPYQNVRGYISDRTDYFGPGQAYSTFAAESDTELANTKWVGKKRTVHLRSLLEFGNNHRQQDIFYRWVRKAYKRKYGENTNVPELIRKGMSAELATKIAAVRGSVRIKKIHDEGFKAGGFNPRPIKYNNHYLLGTLSEHGTGLAVDIDDGQNAQLTIPDWKFIEGLAGKHVVRSGRWKTEADAEGLWKDIDEINDLFVKAITAKTKAIEKERADKLALEKAAKEKAKEKTPASQTASSSSHAAISHPNAQHKELSPLHEILGKHYKNLSPWAAHGFFHLPLELVLEMHFHGFTWGATFSTNVDLHHFELD